MFRLADGQFDNNVFVTDHPLCLENLSKHLKFYNACHSAIIIM